jgi:hypothetical protein
MPIAATALRTVSTAPSAEPSRRRTSTWRSS